MVAVCIAVMATYQPGQKTHLQFKELSLWGPSSPPLLSA
jgi:hypothetical protein